MNFLKGKLTYILAGVAILWGVIGWIAKWIDNETALSVIWIGLTTFGVRRAIK